MHHLPYPQFRARVKGKIHEVTVWLHMLMSALLCGEGATEDFSRVHVLFNLLTILLVPVWTGDLILYESGVK